MISTHPTRSHHLQTNINPYQQTRQNTAQNAQHKAAMKDHVHFSERAQITPNPDRGLEDFKSIPKTFFPWAIDAHNQITYIDADYKKDTTSTYRDIPIPATLMPYTKGVSIERRKKAQTVLAQMALQKPQFCREVIDKVNAGILNYIQDMEQTNPAIQKNIVSCMRKYMYSEEGFGRLGQKKEGENLTDENLYQKCLDILQCPKNYELSSVLAVQDFMGRVVFAKLKGTPEQEKTFKEYGEKVRPASIFGSNTDSEAHKEMLRGRIRQPGKAQATNVPGIYPQTTQPYEYAKNEYVLQQRARGIDIWGMKPEQLTAANIEIMQHNLVFGAGPSGSTGTLLQAAHLFGGKLTEEQLKQYAFAIVGYLVGGGMHSYHEVMKIAALVDCPYQVGAYEPSLPESFTRSNDYNKWCANYYDIAVLGQRSWNLEDLASETIARHKTTNPFLQPSAAVTLDLSSALRHFKTGKLAKEALEIFNTLYENARNRSITNTISTDSTATPASTEAKENQAKALTEVNTKAVDNSLSHPHTQNPIIPPAQNKAPSLPSSNTPLSRSNQVMNLKAEKLRRAREANYQDLGIHSKALPANIKIAPHLKKEHDISHARQFENALRPHAAAAAAAQSIYHLDENKYHHANDRSFALSHNHASPVQYPGHSRQAYLINTRDNGMLSGSSSTFDRRTHHQRIMAAPTQQTATLSHASASAVARLPAYTIHKALTYR